MRVRLHGWLTGLVCAMLMTAACGGGSAPPPSNNPGTSSPSSNPSSASSDKNSYPVFPTSMRAPTRPCLPNRADGVHGRRLGDQHRLRPDRRSAGGQGGALQARDDDRLSFDASLLRTECHGMEPHAQRAGLREPARTAPDDARLHAGLATHWQVSEDKQTFRFRLNPNARFSDGSR